LAAQASKYPREEGCYHVNGIPYPVNGYEVRVARSSHEALRAMAQWTPDIVVSEEHFIRLG